MKPSTTAAKTTIQQDAAVYTTPRLLAEWEYNRFAVPTVTVSPSQDGDDEWDAAFGDLQSIALPNRPGPGIAKARLDGTVKPLGQYRDTPNAARFYMSQEADTYKYFGSLQKSGTTKGLDGTYAFATPIEINVVYDRDVAANKIVVGFETSYAAPVSVDLHYTLDGTSYFPAMTNVPVGTDGTARVWRGSKGWDITPVYDQPSVIRGVKVIVHSMNKPSAHVDVLQAGARLENDLTDFLVSYDDSYEVSDRTFIAPMGKASANTATITLSNIDGRFNNHNLNSLYYGMIDKKIKFTMDIGIDATPHGGQKYEYIREFTMWADVWGGEGTTTVTVDCKDSSVFLQEDKMPVVFYENTSAGAIIWQVMDLLGYTNYTYTRNAADTGIVIPFYWPDADQTVWDAFSAIAEGTQTAVYFDENDVLQVRPRAAMYADKAVDWNFDAVPNGTKLPDVVDLSVNYDLEVNSVDVTYQNAHYSNVKPAVAKTGTSTSKGVTTTTTVSSATGSTTDTTQQMQPLWQPQEDTVLLRASNMLHDLLATDTDLWITKADAITWPFESDLNIEGELLHYKGKEYAYYQAGTSGGKTTHTLKKKVVYSREDQEALDALDSLYSFKNSFTGKFKVTDRGLYGTAATNHYFDSSPSFYSYTARGSNATNRASWTGGGYVVRNGYLHVTNNNKATDAYHVLKNPMPIDMSASRSFFGTRILFPTGGVAYRAGIIFGGDDGRSGYQLEIGPTLIVDKDKLHSSQEVSLSVMPANGTYYYAPPIDSTLLNSGKFGYDAAIATGTWYDVDVKWEKWSSGDVSITAYLNGVYAGGWNIPKNQVLPNNGRFGVFVRGNCVADFEYLYAVTEDPTNPLRDPDTTNFLALERGGYASGFLNKSLVYKFGPKSPRYKTSTGTTHYPQRIHTNKFVFSEFAPVVHEVRKFNVQFDESNRPVSYSDLYLSNDLVDVLYYDGDAFGAEFMLANASRKFTVLKGDDTITLNDKDSPITQQMFAYGVSVFKDDEKTVTKTDDVSVRRRGTIKTAFTSPYIQTETMAKALGQWILDLWSQGVDEVTMNVFGNPFIQLGDLVTINYPFKNMTPATHKYFVVNVKNNFDKGYKTEVTVRRARV
jgi:hypothetical protein